MVSGETWQARLFGDPEIAGLFADEAAFATYLRFEIALALALADAGLADPARAKAAAASMETFMPDMEAIDAALSRDGLPVPEWVRQLKAHVGEIGDGIVHHGATSQDLIDTATVVALLAALDIFETRLSRLDSVFDTLAETNAGNRLMAYTRMQPALPIRANDRISSWRRPLAAAQAKVPYLRQTVGQLQFGGAIGTLEALGEAGAETAHRLGERLGLPWPGHSWHTDRTAFAEFAGFLSTLTGSLGKFGQDVALMAMRGTEIEIAGGGGSSAMPHKKNPVAAEKLVALARYNAVLVSGVHQALLHEEERSGAAWALEWMTLPKMTEAAGAALATAADLAASIGRIGEPDA